MPTDPLLARAKRLRDRMTRVCDEARMAYRQAVLEAFEAEHIATHELAKALGINRQTVYDLAKRARENDVKGGAQAAETPTETEE